MSACGSTVSCDSVADDDDDSDDGDVNDDPGRPSACRAKSCLRDAAGDDDNLAGDSAASFVAAPDSGCRRFLRAASCDSSCMNCGSILNVSAPPCSRGFDLIAPPPHTMLVVIERGLSKHRREFTTHDSTRFINCC